MHGTPDHGTPSSPELDDALHARTVNVLADLIRFDTSNDGTRDSRPERPAAEYCAALLAGVGVDVELAESKPGRTNLVARIPGRDRDRPPLLLHGHLDVVPAVASDWSVHPFAAEVKDGCVWGRGAVDMKNMVAMLLVILEQRVREGRAPSRDVVLALLADEEDGGHLGSRWMVQEHRDHFAECDAAISEVGGFSVTGTDGRRGYLIEMARKGVAIMEATVRSRPGHGSLVHDANAIARLCHAVGRIADHRWPAHDDELTERILGGLGTLLGREVTSHDIDLSDTPLASVESLIVSSIRHTTNPTVLRAGAATNVVPARASATIDGRFLPGLADEFLSAVRDLLGDGVDLDVLDFADSGTSPLDHAIVGSMVTALDLHDPGAVLIPFTNPASTDNVAFGSIGIPGYGFVPLQLPPDFDFGAMFHGIDERIPLRSLEFGTRVLDTFLDIC